jgi:hypothetical protein
MGVCLPHTYTRQAVRSAQHTALMLLEPPSGSSGEFRCGRTEASLYCARSDPGNRIGHTDFRRQWKGKSMQFSVDFQNDPVSLPVFVALLISLGGFIALTILAVTVLVYCKIFAKAGYCWALGLLMLVPIVNIVLPLVIAFVDWPIQKELSKLKQQLSNA